jgi:membrane associated rhomboid family serine protease
MSSHNASNDSMRHFASPLGGGLPVVVKNLLILNGLFYLLRISFPTDALGRNELDIMLGLHYIGSPLFQPWQLVTHMFMHGGIWHLAVNMFALFMFGAPVERVFGSQRFLAYYLATGFGAVALHTAVNAWEVREHLATLESYGVHVSAVKAIAAETSYDIRGAVRSLQELQATAGVPGSLLKRVFQEQIITMIGASGAVFGVLLAFGMMFPNTELFLLFPPIPIKAKYFVVGYGLIELYAGLRQSPTDNVAHFAHLGGMVFGFFIIRHWRRSLRI